MRLRLLRRTGRRPGAVRDRAAAAARSELKQASGLVFSDGRCQALRVADLGTVLPDLRAESADLDTLVAGLTPDDWARATPAPGWTIAHQVAHLIWADDLATGAATDPD